MSQEMDRFTFQFAELKGKSYYPAFGKVTRDFLHAFRANKHYEIILSAFLERLFGAPENISPENYKHLETELNERCNAILAEERARDKERLAKGRKPVYELQEEEEDEEEEEPVISEAERERLEAERIERERAEEERAAAREAERRRNEEILRARARQVDAQAMAKVLEGAVLLNSGQLKPKNGGKQSQQQATMEDLREMELQVARLMREKERLQTVLHTDESELPGKLQEAKEMLEATLSKMETPGDASGGATRSAPLQPKQLTARLAELKQKVTKITAERNRLSLQLKANPHPLHEEILSVLRQRDEALLKLENS